MTTKKKHRQTRPRGVGGQSVKRSSERQKRIDAAVAKLRAVLAGIAAGTIDGTDDTDSLPDYVPLPSGPGDVVAVFVGPHARVARSRKKRGR
jgi:hypothetical protein